MVIDQISVRLVSQTNGEVEGVFVLGEHVYGDHITLTLQYPSCEITTQASDYFEALCQIRRQLEPTGRRPVCYGSSRNVWPSGMCRGMGLGIKAYKTQLGRQALRADLVSIFETGADVVPSLVEEQQQFHQEWLQSLGF